MKTKVISEVLDQISDTVPKCYLDVMKNAMGDVLNHYSLEERRVGIKPYDGQFPRCYNDYMESLRLSGVAESTINLYRMRIESFLSSIEIELDKLTTSDMRTYIGNYKQTRNVQNSTLNNIIHILKSFFSWIFNEQYIDRNPMQNIRALKCEKKIQTSYDSTEIEIIRDKCNNLRDVAIVDFLYSSGCRISEVCSLDIADIDFDNQKFKVKGKGNKWRECYINSRSYVSLKKYLESRTDGNPALFVSVRKPHSRLSKNGVEYMLRDIGEDINMHITPHCFRRTMATHSSQRGMRVEEVQHLLGHADIGTTMQYVKIDNDEIAHKYLRVTA